MKHPSTPAALPPAQRMGLVAESMRDYAILTLDAQGRVDSWNPGAQRLFGYTAAEIVGLAGDTLFTPEDRTRAVPQDEMRRAREDGRAEDDRWHLRRDTSRVYCSGIMTPLYESGSLRGYAKIARDLTNDKLNANEREAVLEREAGARAEAQAAMESKDEFLAVMSHELKNPLNLLLLNAELLLRLPEARGLAAVTRAAETIRDTVQGQAKIIDDLLDLSRINTGKLRLARQPTDWAETVRRIAAAVHDDAAGRGVEIALDLDCDPVVLDADPVRLEQVVWNLLTNALKFTARGGKVNVRLACEDGDGVLHVQDTGRGIEPAFLDKVFDLFQQAELGWARGQRGLGIGLSLVRHLVESHGGTVRAASAGPGKGSTFSVWLPLRKPVGGGALPQPLGHGGLAGRKVLVVDDEPENGEALRALLHLEGLVVTVATSGEEALELLATQRFDALLSDIVMPGMGGYELLERLRAQPDAVRVPAIALSGYGRALDVQRALDAGFDAHVGKPFTLQRLTELLRAVLEP